MDPLGSNLRVRPRIPWNPTAARIHADNLHLAWQDLQGGFIGGCRVLFLLSSFFRGASLGLRVYGQGYVDGIG